MFFDELQARRAVDRWEVGHSDFLSPPVLGDALMAVRRLSDVGAVVSGGYAQVWILLGSSKQTNPTCFPTM